MKANDYGVMGASLVPLMYLLLQKGALQTQGSNPSPGVVPFFCVSQSLRESSTHTFSIYLIILSHY